MMTRFAVTALAIASLGTAATADKIVRPADSPAGSWSFIATSHAKHMGDHDTLILTGPNNRFHALRLRVFDAPIRLQRMRIIYEGGQAEEIPAGFTIPQGAQSPIFDLHGGARRIHQVDFWYDTKGWLKGTANVALFGLR